MDGGGAAGDERERWKRNATERAKREDDQIRSLGNGKDGGRGTAMMPQSRERGWTYRIL